MTVKKTVKKRVKKAPRKRKFEMGMWLSPKGVPLTRCSNTMTEAEYFAFILSHCRRITRRWKPAFEKMDEGKRPYTGSDKRTKWEYQCEGCSKWFKAKEIQLDHIIPLGGINGWDKIPGWFERALCEKDGLQRLCRDVCHYKKTQQEKYR